MFKKRKKCKLGSLAFIIGIIIAIIAGFWNLSTGVTSFLIILGLIAGLLNVTAKETKDFLLAAVSLVLVTSLSGGVIGRIMTIGPVVTSIYSAMLVFIVPATIIVALKAIYSMEKD